MSGTGEVIFGREWPMVNNIHDALKSASESHCEFLVAPLFHPRLRRDARGVSASRLGPATRSDRELSTKEWHANVVGACSDWFDFDSPRENGGSMQRSSEESFMQETSWAVHLGLQAIVIPTPSFCAPNYARVVKRLCEAPLSTFQQIWVKIPLAVDLDCRQQRAQLQDGWEVWDSFRHLVGHHHRLSVALDITETLPDEDANKMAAIMNRWAAEPVKAVIISTHLFTKNKTGHPVLRKKFQPILVALLRFRMHCIFSGPSDPECENKFVNHIAYVRHLKSRVDSQAISDAESEGEKATTAYRDTLQSPLQPLMDNLEAQTYEVFESDPVKYDRYEEATRKALADLLRERALEPEPQLPPSSSSYIVITVVGAGRGPLVSAALKAAWSLSVPVRIYAVEKNENAVITLRNRVLTEGWTNVTVVAGDMRKWIPPELADILISELLGSWGDNELSPECLDGAQSCLKQPGGISIPCNYQSFVAPLSANKLWMCAKDMLDGKGLDSPFVVKLHACHQIAPAQPLFLFEHPNWGNRQLLDNSRYARLSFTVTQNSTIHGLTGTFESRLYADVTLSIAAHSHTPGLFSWFPLFIPFTTPLRVNAGQTITVCLWRCMSAHKVWYEWCLTAPICTAVQNSGGSSYWVGL